MSRKQIEISLENWVKNGGLRQLATATLNAQKSIINLNIKRQIPTNLLLEPMGPANPDGLWPHEKPT